MISGIIEEALEQINKVWGAISNIQGKDLGHGRPMKGKAVHRDRNGLWPAATKMDDPLDDARPKK